MEYILKGDLAFSKNKNTLETIKNGYIHVKNGIIEGTYKRLPEALKKKKLLDYSGKLIIPGMSDLHLHASQFGYKGTAMDVTLLEWLDKYTFPIEAKFKDEKYAKKAYKIFVESLRKTFTTRAVIFATLHLEATTILASMLEKAGIEAYVGLVDMDRNVPDFYRHSVEEAKNDNIEFINRLKDYKHVKPIITPRFTVSCTDEMLSMLGEVRKEYGVASQSHLDENRDEIAFVKSLCPDAKHYTDTYDKVGLLEGSVMAHCIFVREDELQILKDKNVYLVHCPDSNTNVSTGGICPVRKYLDRDMHIGLGSDVAGGSTLNLLEAMKLAIQLSKLINYGQDTDYSPLTAEEAFYLGTLGGGSYFGKVGTFAEGYDADIVVVDDLKNDPSHIKFSIRDRVERLIYSGQDSFIVNKFVKGKKVL
ncbi:MAG: amidohydrolase family protein [Bacilli bacterium]|nr:amidohydrolase family protein [Bacilli bacterium]